MEPFDVEDPFALDAEALARRGHHLHPWSPLDDLRQKLRALDQVLEVVQDQQRRALAQEVQQLILRREAAVRPVHRELERLGHGGRQEVGRSDRSQGDEVDAVLVAVQTAARGLQRQAGLPDPARTQQGEEATARIPQQPVDRLELLSPSHERRRGGREVRAARVERLERREAGGKAVDFELVDPLRSAQILEPVRP